MKKIYSLMAAAVLTAGFTSCEDAFDTDTTTFRYENGTMIKTESGSFYSAMGILNQLQALGERYVLLGELRGDLVNVTPDADFSLREVSEFDISPDNVFLSTRDYYAVINNCNYALDRIDTEVELHGTKVLLPDYVAILTMRNWTYLQMALNFGSVKYITKPLLSFDQTLEQFPSVSLDQLVPMLIADLLPYAEIETPNYGGIDGYDSGNFFIQPKLLLGDLYLYNNEYDNAAQMYYSYIERSHINYAYGSGNRWVTSSMDAASIGHTTSYSNEIISMIPYSSDAREYHPNLVNLTYNTRPSIIPATWWTNEMEDIEHYHVDNMSSNVITGFLQGDLRGNIVYRGGRRESSSTYGNFSTGNNSTATMIAKFYHNADAYSSITSPGNEMFGTDNSPRLLRRVAINRIPHVYLRFAEAANRAGKPTLAFAVLKYGLNRQYMTQGQPTGDDDDTVVKETPVINPEELADGKTWTNFAVLDLDNYGSAMRGRGLGIRLEGSGYVIPELATRNDSIDFVENEIVREMAAETAFEGNRFFDLLRVSHHRADHPAYFAEKVSARFENPAEARARLSNSNNWWIK